MKRLLLLMLLSLVGTSVSAAEDCFDRIAQKKGLDADLLRAIAFVESSGNPSAVGRNASSEDYGLMQINSGWLKRFKTSKSELLNDACFNVQVAVQRSWRTTLRAPRSLGMPAAPTTLLAPALKVRTVLMPDKSMPGKSIEPT